MKPIPRDLRTLAQLAVARGIADQCSHCELLFEIKHPPLMPCFRESRSASKQRVCPDCIPSLLSKQDPASAMRTRRSLVLQFHDDSARVTPQSQALLDWKLSGLRRDTTLADWIDKTAHLIGPALLHQLDHLIATTPTTTPDAPGDPSLQPSTSPIFWNRPSPSTEPGRLPLCPII